MSDGGSGGGALAERVVVVLVRPLHPGNVGATARAMRNFGLERLVLVDPPAYDPERARWMAPGCADLLARARIVGDLAEALQGVHRVVGTTARHRRYGQPVIEPPALAEEVVTDDRVWAVLFGREDFGLDNAAVLKCERLVRIATPEHASLNLAQAVLLVAHHLYEVARRHGGAAATGRRLGGRRAGVSTSDAERGRRRDRPATAPDLDPAIDAVLGLLHRVGYLRGTSPDKVRATATTALQRAGLSVRHVEALRGMVARIGWALDHAGGSSGDGEDTPRGARERS